VTASGQESSSGIAEQCIAWCEGLVWEMIRQASLIAAFAVTSYAGLSRTRPILLESHSELTLGIRPPNPSVYAMGSNRSKVVADSDDLVVRIPHRLSYFDGKLLRDLAIGEDVGVAVLENGDVVQWGYGHFTPKYALRGKGIVKVGLADDKAVFGLAKDGSIYSWDADLKREAGAVSWWWKIWASPPEEQTKIKLPSLSFREYVKDISVGVDHILALTSRGRVFSGSTGTVKQSKGQYGIAGLSQFNTPPKPGTLHEIKLLDSPVEQVATGDFHSLVRTKDGKLLAFGENVYGQLGFPYSYRTANIAVPTALNLDQLNTLRPTRVSDIAAGGSISYFTVEGEEGRDIYAMGNGISGQLGTGNFSNSQRKPLKIKHLGELVEFSEETGKSRSIGIESWSVGRNHTSVTLDNSVGDGYGRDVLVWGGNEFSQLGNGKRSSAPHPVPVPDSLALHDALKTESLQLIEGEIEFKTDTGKKRTAEVRRVFVCGSNTSALYYKVV
jgi:alpha-tubulin suppressor-like RCC1 family protein